MEKKIKLVKCIQCGATLNNLKCSYCGTDYNFSKDFTDEINKTDDPKIKGYYKLLDVAFNSGDYVESYKYANNILELEPENTEVWGIKIYSSVNLMSVSEFENGNGMVILKQVKHIDKYYQNKIAEIIFSYAISFIINEPRTDLNIIYETAKTSLEYIDEKEKNRQTLYYSISKRNPKFWDQFQNKSRILNEVKSLYQSNNNTKTKNLNINNAETKKVSNNFTQTNIASNTGLKEAKNGFILGILSIPGSFFCILPGIVLGILGFFQSKKAISIYQKNTDNYSKNDLKKANNGKILSIVGFSLSILFIIITPFLTSDDNKKTETNDNTSNKIELTIEEQTIRDSIEQVKKDSLELSEKIKNDSIELANIKTQIEREITSIDEGIDFSQYDNTVESLQIEIVVFGAWAKIINDGKSHENKEIQNLAKKLERKVVQIQIREFPKLRKKYTKIVANKLWENDIDVYCNGSGNRYINLTGGVFAANKNIGDFQTTLSEILHTFRFTQSRYRWYKGSEYTYYDMKPKKDSELVTF